MSSDFQISLFIFSGTVNHTCRRHTSEVKSQCRAWQTHTKPTPAIYYPSTDTYLSPSVSRVTHSETGCSTYRRKQRLHILVGVCYRGQVNQVPVQDLLVPMGEAYR
ncbi:hypothetical protein A6R68_12510 [Neotoma lepida]|uniref:Uncharacterized protein n=1 Tax=Neotoma lepida TaxID=56216 RepID=A0A1A6H531_NEOLE|nr:hypothetical protein A6R68_12510 [Neotoma lepida]